MMNWKYTTALFHHELSILFLCGLVLSIILLYSHNHLIGSNVPVISLQLCAVAIIVWARKTMGFKSFFPFGKPLNNSTLVINGPYRYVRHPIYSAILLFIWAGIMSHGALSAVWIGIAITGLITARLLHEEYFLKLKFNAYKHYASNTKRLVPFVF